MMRFRHVPPSLLPPSLLLPLLLLLANGGCQAQMPCADDMARATAAIAPLAPELPPAVRDRLHRALSIVYGIGPYIFLKDIWGLPDREVESIALWMADALIDTALRNDRESSAQPAPAGKAGR